MHRLKKVEVPVKTYPLYCYHTPKALLTNERSVGSLAQTQRIWSKHGEFGTSIDTLTLSTK